LVHLGLFEGAPVKIIYRASLRDTAGNPAHAATFIRRREIVLDPVLKNKPGRHCRILLHEYFHFAWVRLGNRRREAWEAVLASEQKSHVRGEAGWSAEWRKQKLVPRDVAERSRFWREYCCESFCDTAAFVFAARSGYAADRSEVTLSTTRLRARAVWFGQTFPDRTFAI
jgi:hypothetical protein